MEGTDIEEELTADLVGDYLFTDADFVNRLSTENRNVFQKIYDEIKYLCKVVTAGSKEARQLEKAKKIFEDAFRAEAKNTVTEDGVRYALSERKVQDIQSIGRKSINSFSSYEIQKTEPLARKYQEEMGTKSPYFRAWFGDWRANDDQTVNTVTTPGNTRGIHRNADTGWKINISSKVKTQNDGHGALGDKAAKPYLQYLDGIVENAILLDSSGSDPKSINTLLMHSMYAVADVGAGPEVLKLYVEEMNDPNSEATTKRAYTLVNIEKAFNAGGRVQASGPSSGTVASNAIKTVSDLFTAVKTYDANFSPNPSSKVVNADGTPKVVYHGTNATFNVFQSQSGEYWFSEYEDYAESMMEERGGGEVKSVYLNMRNPYRAKLSPGQFTDPTYEAPILRNAKAAGYDGVIIENDTTDPLAAETFYVVFNPEQIKSATDNIGIFDGGNPDIRYSLSEDGEQIAPYGNYNVSGKDIALDIAPVAENATVQEKTQLTEDNSTGMFPDDFPIRSDMFPDDFPIREELDELYQQKKALENRMQEARNAGDEDALTDASNAYGAVTARIGYLQPENVESVKEMPDNLENAPTKPKKRGMVMKGVTNFVDKGMVFENLSLETKNMELQAKWDYALPSKAEGRAQRFMERGNARTKSLDAIMKQVGPKTHDFSLYLYHLHNIDRMTLETRFGIANKTVFGELVTADASRQVVQRLEKANPEFKKYAEDVYAYNRNLREMLVEGGMITQETADLWEKMYPHYVPISRDATESINGKNTRHIGISGPVKKATGGNGNIHPLFQTMAERTIQTYKSVARNDFGVELKNTLGSKAEALESGVDDIIDSIGKQESLLGQNEKGSPTFTVFEDGKRVTFDITEDMLDALKPTSEGLAYRNKVLTKVSGFRRNLLTTWNPVFALYRNPVKDLQEVFVNSQHPVKTYANIPTAAKELFTNGKWATEYLDNGGDSNSYYDKETGTFGQEESALKKAIGIGALEKAGDFIEKVPRLAEYIASRQEGQSVQRSMLDSARVTTNFAAGGDVTKFLNAHGFSFLNASVQGFSQHVRNVREAKMNGLKGTVKMIARYTLAGLPGLLNHLLWEDDEDYGELSPHVKQNYYIIGKTEKGKFIRIPKGRTAAVAENALEQMGNLVTGNDEADFGTFFELFMNNIAPNNPMENNILAPIVQVANNKTWYGEDLVPSRLADLPAEEQFDESTDAISKWLGEKAGISPVKLNYLLDQYSGGLGDVILPMLTPEAESGDDTILGNLIAPWKKELTTDRVLNNKYPSAFYELKDAAEIVSNGRNATAEDKLRNQYLESVGWDMSSLYAEKREVQNSDLTDSEKYEQVRQLQEQINSIAEEALNEYQNVSIDGDYAMVGDRVYKLSEDGEWSKLSDEEFTKYEVTKAAGSAYYATDGTNHYKYTVKDGYGTWYKISEDELKKQREVTKGLGISPEEYWRDKTEYTFAYNQPENYAVAKAVGGYDAYTKYSRDLYNIKADKDKNGKSISGSKQAKVLDYINNLDADYYTKLILYKSQYNSYDAQNDEILEYLNSRTDLTYQEKVSILKKLGADVDSEGRITW